MKKIILGGSFKSAILCAVAIMAPAISLAQTAPFTAIQQTDRTPSRSAQEIADEWTAAMPQSLWSDVANTDWYTADGTEFTLTTPEQFAGLAKLVNSGKSMKGVTIKLGNDVDFSDNRFDQVIGFNNDNPFSGTFDGGNHTITGVMISSPTDGFSGFFGQTNEAVIRNTVIRNSTVIGSSAVGALVSNVFNNGLVSNCHAFDCRIVTAPFESAFGGNGAGSVVGALVDFSKIENSSASGMEIYCGSQSGAFVAQAYNKCEVDNCFVENSKITADTGLIGGFVGVNFAIFPNTESTFTNCYALNIDIKALDNSEQSIVGGFVGQASANFTAKYCYVSTQITGGSVGAFAGMTNNESGQCFYEGCFYNSETNESIGGTGNEVEIAGIVGKKEAEMKSAEMAAALNRDQSSIQWLQANNINNGWPYLQNNTPIASSISAPSAEGVQVWAVRGQIHIESSMPSAVCIYNMQGQQIYTNQTATNLQVNVLPGSYIVRVGNKSSKVTVD